MRRSCSAVGFSIFVLIGMVVSISQASTWYVDGSVGSSGDGTEWSTAWKTIQEGVDAAADGDTVLVTNGTYSTGGVAAPGFNLTNRVCITNTIVVSSVNGPTTTFIEGALGSNGSNDNDSVRGVFLTNGCSLIGFTVRDGYTMASGSGELDDRYGGGLWLATNCLVSNAVICVNVASESGGGAFLNRGGTIKNSVVTNNYAGSYGGGVFLYAGGAVEDCTLRGNAAGDSGGGAELVTGGALDKCTLVGNTARDGGGARLVASGTLNNCTLIENSATISGGGCYLNNGGTVNNCLLMKNHSDANAGGVYLVNNGVLNNCTFVNNDADSSGGGAILNSGGEMNNSIVWSNSTPEIQSGLATFRNTCAPAGVTHGTDGCITNHPLFLDYANSNYALQATSPCKNSGSNTYAPTNVTPYDLNGDARILFGTVDMGAYELQLALSADNGPAAGGNTIVLTNGPLGNGSDITSVEVCGSTATIEDQGVDWVEITLGASTNASLTITGDVVIQSTSLGESTFEKAYTYNPVGGISPVEEWPASQGMNSCSNATRLDESSGSSVSGIGDFNADGIDDFITGSYHGNISHVFFGATNWSNGVFSTTTFDGTNGFSIDGASGEYAGRSVSGAGDVNGDSIDDIIIGAPGAGIGGKSYVVYGTTNEFSASFATTGIDGTNGFVLEGIAAGDECGTSVGGAGDVNGDGVDDVIIGAYKADPGGLSNAGEVYVVFGNTNGFAASFALSSLDGTNGFCIEGTSYLTGMKVNGADDVNGDGIDDVIIGAPYANSYTGMSYVVFGSTNGFDAAILLSDLNGTNGFTIEGASREWSGMSVGGSGDINGDGIDDVSIGAEYGEDYVVFGTTNGFDALIGLSNLDGTNGFCFTGATSGTIAGAGDVNADGIDDLIIGSPYWAAYNNGELFVVFGTRKGFGASVALSNLDGSTGFRLGGDNYDAYLGSAVAGAGDVNGDGVGDFIVGASGNGDSFLILGKGPFGITPSRGSWVGGTQVTITGSNLCNGTFSDVTNVTLCGASAVVDSVYGTTQIVVTAGAGSAGTGDVHICSSSYGETIKTNGFTYLNPGLLMLGTNRDAIISGADAQFSNGSKFTPLLLSVPWTNTFSITNDGTEEVSISGYGISDSRFQVSGIPSSLAVGAVSNVTIVYTPDAIGSVAASLVITNDSLNPVYTVNLAGSCYGISTNVGPYAGGNTITVTNGNFGAITNVLVGSTSLSVLPSAFGTNWFTITLPASVNAGPANLVVQTSDNGDTAIANAYTYNPEGRIGFAEWSASLSLSFLNGTNGFRIDGIDPNDVSGRFVCGAGDVNGDGIDDVLLGGGQANEAYLVFGVRNGLDVSFALDSLDGTNGFCLGGGSGVGNSGSGVGDVNGDGIDDFIVGPNYVIFGSTNGYDAWLALNALDGTNGFTLTDGGGDVGCSISGAGDVNADGIDDMLIGARSASPGGISSAGETYVIFGNTNGFTASFALNGLDGTNGFRLDGGGVNDGSGWAVGRAGDVNGDDIDDILIGAPYAAPGGMSYAGSSYVVFGSANGFAPSLLLSSLDGTNGFSLHGLAEGDRGGFSVSAGDVNGDGIDDVLIGASGASPGGITNAGVTYVVFGTEGGFDASFLLSSLDGTNGFCLEGVVADAYSQSMSSAGDVNDDGNDDILIGARAANSWAGISYLVFGSTNEFAASIPLSSLDGTNGVRFSGIDGSDQSGNSVSGVGDVNGDFVEDFVIGANRANSDAGESYVIFGNGSGVGPRCGAWTGGYQAVISGSNLGNGWDITNVTLCGIEVVSIDSQTSSRVVVTVAADLPVGVGDVCVYSLSFGKTTGTNAFSYVRAQQEALSFAPPAVQDYLTTNALSSSGGTGTGEVSYAVVNGPGMIVNETNLVATSGTGRIFVSVTKAQDDLYFSISETRAVVAAKIPGSVFLDSLSQTYDGSARSVTATSDPSGMTVEYTYDGDPWAPTNAGSYAVTGTIDDLNYEGSASDTLVVDKVAGSLYLTGLNQLYDGTARSVTATTDPSGLTVEFTYDGDPWAPTNAGSYAVTGTINDANSYENTATGTLVIGKAGGDVYLTDLAQTYDGTARSVTATTDPSGLTIELTYDGNSWAPTNAGSYVVTGLVNELNYEGAVTDVLVVAKVAGSAYLQGLAQTYDGTARSVTATTDPSGLTVEFTYDGNSWAPTNAGTYAVTGTINDANSHQTTVTNMLVVNKDVGEVYLLDLAQNYDGTAKSVTATSYPSGLTIELTYDGNSWGPTNMGSYAVTGTINDVNYQGETVGTLEIDAFVLYVDASRPDDSGAGTSWASAKKTIQAAVDAVAIPGMVWVTNGTYSTGGTPAAGDTYTNRVCITNAITVQSVNGAEVTCIDGEDKVRCVYMTGGGVLNGFTVTNGSAIDCTGGGIYLETNCVVSNCVISGNFVDGGYSGGYGGGVYCQGGGVLNHCRISGNLADGSYGGGRGAGVYMNNGGVMNNSVIYANVADRAAYGGWGGGIYIINGGGVNNCTIHGNTAVGSSYGGGVSMINAGSIQNCIVWGNSATTGKDIRYTGASVVRYTCASDGVTDAVDGCTTNNPLFYDADNRNYQLYGDSPCFNTGNNDYAPTNQSPCDALGHTRIMFGDVDMGAYERQFMLSESSGRYSGGNLITLTNGSLGNGSDITNVTVQGVEAVIEGQGTNWVSVTMPAGTGLVDLLIQSSSFGDKIFADAYTYNPQGAISGMSPSNGVYDGMYSAAIRGANLCNGVLEDVTNATICGVEATVTAVNGSTQVVVTVGAGTPGTGDVVIHSFSHGTTICSNAFEYLRKDQSELVFTPTSPQTYHTTNTLSVSGGSGTGEVSYAIVSGPGQIVDDTELSVTSGSGTIRVSATKAQDEFYYATSVTGTVVAAKAVGSIYLDSLSQTYTGEGLSVTSTTDPSGLTVDFTYDGNAGAPTNAGSYVVVGLINELNYEGAVTDTLVIAKATCNAYLSGLDQVYDGSVKSVSATSDPSGLTIELTYDGHSWAPTNAGSYAITGTIDDANYHLHTATGTLVVGKASGSVYLADLSHLYDGTAKSVAVTTDPSGLTVELTYEGNAWAPTNAGSYAVTGTINDVNSLQNTATNTLVINKKGAQVYLSDLAQTYDGMARNVAVTTDPSGLTVELTYEGYAWAPTNAGSYEVGAIVNDVNHAGSTTDTLVVSKALAGVYLDALSQTYDGSARSVISTSDPSGLTVEITYDGNAWAPTNAGSYAVTGTLNDMNYQGSAADILVVDKLLGDIYIADLLQTYDGYSKSVTATSVPSGLAIGFTYDGNAWAPTNAGSYVVTGTFENVNCEGESTDTLVIGKAVAGVYLSDLLQSYDGMAKSISATSDPSGLAIEFTYDGNAWAPTNVGSYAVTGTINDVNYQGEAADTLIVRPFAVYVDAARPDDFGAGTNWATAKRTIQAAVDFVAPSGTVWVTNGVYSSGGRPYQTSTLTNRVCITNQILLSSVNGPEVTIIDGLGTSRCVYLVEGSRLAGFTVTNGAALTAVSAPLADKTGGGIWMAIDCVVSNCVVSGNTAPAGMYGYGGGVRMNSGGVLTHSVINGNVAGSNGGRGGGVFMGSGSLVNTCTIRENIAGASYDGSRGGGVYMSVNGTLNNCNISANLAKGSYGGGSGGGVYVNNGCTLNNCVISANMSTNGVYSGLGGGAYLYGSGALNNCTVSGNAAAGNSSQGGGVALFNAGAALNNCVVWNNSAVSGNDIYNDIGGALRFSCASDGVTDGVNGCITNDPLFCDADNHDYQLYGASPCLNAGNNDYAPTNQSPCDLLGNARIMFADVDLGAYERQFMLSGYRGRYSGGNTVTITNDLLAGDVTNVIVEGGVAMIEDQGPKWVSVAMPAGAGRVGLLIQSGSLEDLLFENAYTYNPQGMIVGVDPASGSYEGTYQIVIAGTNLSDGSVEDISSVSVCGVTGVLNGVNGSTQLVVTVDEGLPGVGDVVVNSIEYGMTVGTNAFEYLKLDQTISFNAISPKTYGAVAFDLGASADSGLVVSYAISDIAIATNAGSMVYIVGAGTCDVVVVQAGNTYYNPAEPVTNRLVVNAKSLTVSGTSADNKVYDGTTGATLSGGSLVGVVGSDAVTLGNASTGTFASAGVGTSVAVTSYMTLGGADAGNYSVVQPTLNADVTALGLTVSGASADNKVYDGTTDATLGGGSLIGVVGSDTVTLENASTGTFASAGVGTSVAVTSYMTLGGADAGNYSVVQPTLNADVTALGLTVSGTSVDNKVYDGTSAATLSGGFLVGVVSGDTVTLDNASTGIFASVSVGSNIAVTSYMSLGGSEAGNYSLSQPTLDADITALGLIVSGASANNKVYDGTTAATLSGGSLAGVVSGDTVTLGNASTGTFASAGVGTSVAVTSYMTLGGADAGNYSVVQPTLNADVTALGLTVSGASADNKVYDGTIDATLGGGSLIGVVGSDTVTLDNASTGTFASAGVGTSVAVTSYMTLGGADAGNYSVSQPLLSADITALGLTVSGVSADSKVYDGTTDATLSGGSLVGVVGSDTVTLGNASTGTFVSVSVGTNIAVTSYMLLGGSEASNYSLSQPTLNADITALGLTVSGASADSKVYGGTVAAMISGGSLVGVVGSDAVTLDNASTGTFASASVGTNIAVTSYMSLGGSESGNYSLSQPALSADITALGLTVSGASADNKVYDGTVAATISGGSLVGVVGSDTVTLDNGSTGTFASASIGTSISVTSYMSLDGSESGNYSLSQPTLDADITALGLTVSGASADNKVYDGTVAAMISGGSLVGVVGSDTVTLENASTGTFVSVSVGTNIAVTSYMLLGGSEASNYSLSQPTLNADITALGLTVSGASADSKVYDGTVAAMISGGSLVGVVGSDAVTLGNASTGTFASASMGTNISVISYMSLGGSESGNYSLSQPTLNADITALGLTVSGASADNKVYDGTIAATISGGSLVGVVGSDAVTLDNASTGTFASASMGTNISVTSYMSLGGSESGNYSLSQPTLDADIAALGLTVSGASADSKVYDGTVTATISGGSLVGVVGSDTVALDNASTGTFATASAGTNIVVTSYMRLSGADGGNYSLLSQPTLSADITKASQVISFSEIPNMFWTNTTHLSATASSGLPIGFSVLSGPAQISGGSNLSCDAIGTVSIVASQAGNENYHAAVDVTNSFQAIGPEFMLMGTNGAVIESDAAIQSSNGTYFGSALMGIEAFTNTFVLANTGSAPLRILDVVTNGSSSFSLKLTSVVVAVSSEISMPIVFNPVLVDTNRTSFTFRFDGTNSPYALPVGGVGFGGGITFATNTLNFTANYMGTNPAEQTLVMTNVGVGYFNYTNMSSDAWLSVIPVGGEVAVGAMVILTNQVDITGLNAGVYTATNWIHAPDATNSPQAFMVSLTVDKSSQTISFQNPGDQMITNVVNLSATASSDLPVSFHVVTGNASISDGTNLTFYGTNVVRIVAVQEGNENFTAASPILREFNVFKVPQAALVFSPSSPQVYGTTNMLSTSGGSGTGEVSYAVSSGGGQIIGNRLVLTTGTGVVSVVATKASDLIYHSTASTGMVTCSKADATVALVEQSYQYDGSAKPASATTIPSGLAVDFTYNGNTWAPTNVGSYQVIGILADNNYQGGVTGLLVVVRGMDSITFSGTNQVYDGTAKTVQATSANSQTVAVTYNGNLTAPTAAGAYVVTGVVGTANWAGTNVTLLTIGKADQTITFSDPGPQHVTNVIELTSVASSGLAVSYVVDSGPGNLVGGTNLSFSAVGDVLLTATQSGDANYNAAPDITHTVKVYSVSSSRGPAAGGGMLVVTNGTLGNGLDITNVTVCGSEAGIITQGMNWVEVLLGISTDATHQVVGDIEIQSVSEGYTRFTNAYSYNPEGEIKLLTPAYGSWTGGYEVVISGADLCNGTLSDVTQVTLCGNTAPVELVSSPTQLVVLAGSGVPGTGDVVMVSTDFGITILTNGFEYMKEAQTITFAGISPRTYGDMAFDAGATASSGLPVSYTTSDAGVATNAGSLLYITGTGICEVIAVQAGDMYHDVAPNVTNVLVVTQKVLTVTGASADNKMYDGTTSATISGALLSGVVGSDAVTLENGQVGAFADSSVGTGKVVNTAMSLSGAESGFYMLTQPTGLSADITVKDLTVSGSSADSKVYDGTAGARLSGSSLSGVIEGDVVVLLNSTTGTFAQATAGVGISVTSYMVIGGAHADNYTLSQPALTANITVRQLSVSGAVADDKTYDGTTAATISGGALVGVIAGDTVGLLTAPTGTFATANVGYNIPVTGHMDITGTDSGNYTLSQPYLTADIMKADQAIIFNTIPVQETMGHLELSATSGSGLAVSFMVVGGPAILSGDTNLSFSGAGTVSISASQAGDMNWNAAPEVTNTFAVIKSIGEVIFTNLALPYDGSARRPTVFTSPTGLVVNLAFDGNDWAPTNMGSYQVVGMIEDDLYQGGATDTFVIARAIDVISFSETSHVYDGTAKAVIASSVNSQTVAVSYNGSISEPVSAGTYAITGVVDSANWVGTNTTVMTIHKANQTVSFSPIADQILTNSFGLSGDASSGLPVSFTVLSGSAQLSGGTNLTFTYGGAVSIGCSQAGDANWNASSNVVQTFEVLPVIPRVTTLPAISVGETSVESGGQIVSDGGALITQRGICWSRSSAPDTSDYISLDGTGNGFYSSMARGLDVGTRYYIRAYAVNESGTAYGSEISITTSNQPAPPPAVLDYTWNGLKNRMWSNLDNWVGDSVPVYSNVAYFYAVGTKNIQVDLNGARYIKGLVLTTNVIGNVEFMNGSLGMTNAGCVLMVSTGRVIMESALELGDDCVITNRLNSEVYLSDGLRAGRTLSKVGRGALNLNGPAAFSGDFVARKGLIVANDTMHFSSTGKLVVGENATLKPVNNSEPIRITNDVAGCVAAQFDGAYEIEISGQNITSIDLANNLLSLGSNSVLNISDGAGSVDAKKTYTIATYAGLTGRFSQVNGLVAHTLSYESNAIMLEPTFLWVGSINSNWNESGNWTNSTGALPGPESATGFMVKNGAESQVNVDTNPVLRSIRASGNGIINLNGEGRTIILTNEVVKSGQVPALVAQGGVHLVIDSDLVTAPGMRMNVQSYNHETILRIDGQVSGLPGIGNNVLDGGGRVELFGENTFGSATNWLEINASTLFVNSDEGLGDPAAGIIFTNGGSLSVSNHLNTGRAMHFGGAGVLKVAGSNNVMTITNVITGSGELSVRGEGMVLLSGDDFVGGVSVESGVLRVIGSLAGSGPMDVCSNAALNGGGVIRLDYSKDELHIFSGAFLEPGTSVGTMTIDGSTTIDGVLRIEIENASNDVVNIRDTLTLSSSSRLECAGEVDGVSNYEFATFNSRSGQFGTISIPDKYTLEYSTTNIVLTAPSNADMGTTNVLREGETIAVDLSISSNTSWSVINTSSWITVASGGSGTGDGTVVLTIAANGGRRRSSTLWIAGMKYTILQRPAVQLDFDGDGRADISVYWPEQGMWLIQDSSDLSLRLQAWGWSETIPVPGDYDGDGRYDVAVYHPESGIWYILDTLTQETELRAWGWSGALPVPGDYDGDGITDLAVYSPENGAWLILQSKSGTGRVQSWGWNDAVPVPGDYDGDGVGDAAVYWPGNGAWLILESSKGTGRIQPWGWRDAVAAPGDYDGDDIIDIAVYWPENGGWYIMYSSTGTTQFNPWGWNEACPVPADYDGDLRWDTGVHWADGGYWYFWDSVGQSVQVRRWGWGRAEPVNSQYWLNSGK